MNDVVFSIIKTAYQTRIQRYLTADTVFSICTNSRTPAASASTVSRLSLVYRNVNHNFPGPVCLWLVREAPAVVGQMPLAKKLG